MAGEPPALRALRDGKVFAVTGASIGDVPDGASLRALVEALKVEAPDLPWAHMLVRRNVRAAPVTIQSIFFPVSALNEASAICAKLAAIPPGCTPVLTSSGDLIQTNGAAVDETALAKLGVPVVAPSSDTGLAIPLRLTGMQERPAEQPELALQPGIRSDRGPVPGALIWLSDKYKLGDTRLVDFVAAGDVMMGSSTADLNPAITPNVDVATLVGNDLAGIFRHADIAFVNLEGPLYDGPGSTAKDCGSCFAFRGPTFYASVLANLGVDAVSLANNHSGDYGEAGRASTMAALRAHGIGYGGLDRDGARAATLVLPGGRKAALVAFAPNEGTLNLNDIPAAEKLIRELKKTHDLVLVSFHGGAEGWAYVHVAKGDEMFDGEDRGDVVRFAHAAIDAGADIVVGQGPHVPRAMELYRGHLIAYSLGNFWTYTGVMNYAVSGLGPVLEAWLAPDGTIAGFTIHSTRQAGLGVPHSDPDDEAARYVLYLTKTDFPQTGAMLERADRSTMRRRAWHPDYERDTYKGTKYMLKWVLRGAALIAVLVLVGAGYLVYATVWGTPLRFNDLLDRQAIVEAIDSPQTLTQLGVIDGAWYDFTSGKLDAYSLAQRQKRFDRTRKFDAEIAAWNRDKLSPQEQLSYDIIRWGYARTLADQKYPWLGANGQLYPVNQAFGIQLRLPNFLLSTHQITNARLARHYVDRLRAMGRVLDAVRLDVARQAKASVIPPDFIIDASIGQMKALIAFPAMRNPLITHLAERTQAIGMDEDGRNALVNRAVEIVQESVYPAYRRLIAEEQSLRAKATHDAGVWRLKGGDAYYADQLKTLTSTDMTPDEIHAYGLSEVARITAQMDTVLRSVGLSDGTVGERMDTLDGRSAVSLPERQCGPPSHACALRTNPRARARNAAQVFRTPSRHSPASAARAAILRKRCARRLLRATRTFRRTARYVLRQSAQYGRNADVGDAHFGLSRRHSRPSHADCDGAGNPRPASAPANDIPSRVRRRVGPVRRTSCEGHGSL